MLSIWFKDLVSAPFLKICCIFQCLQWRWKWWNHLPSGWTVWPCLVTVVSDSSVKTESKLHLKHQYRVGGWSAQFCTILFYFFFFYKYTSFLQMHKGDFLVQICFTGVQRLIYNYKLELSDSVTLHASNLMDHNFELILRINGAPKPEHETRSP